MKFILLSLISNENHVVSEYSMINVEFKNVMHINKPY